MIFVCISISASVGALTAFLATPYMGAAAFSYGLMVSGMIFRRRERRRHRAFMYSAMGIDLALVLLLELQRSAVETVISFSLEALPLAHVACSVAAVACYVPLVWLGTRLWKEESAGTRRWHRRIGLAAFTLRTLGFLLMFSLLERSA